MQLSRSISFTIQWILFTTLSYAIVIALTWSRMEAVVATSQETLFVGLFLSGLLCGLGQSRLIEYRSPGTAGERWIVINIFGIPLGLVVGFFVYFGFESLLLSVLNAQYLPFHGTVEQLDNAYMVGGIFFFAGIFLGILKWLVLRKKVKGASWWIPISGLSWSLGFYLQDIEPPSPCCMAWTSCSYRRDDRYNIWSLDWNSWCNNYWDDA